MKRITLVLIAFILVHCSNDDTTSICNNSCIDNYYQKYMHYPPMFLEFSSKENKLVNIQYDTQNRIVRRVGGLAPINASSGFIYTFSNKTYDSISYNRNRILIERKTSSSDYYSEFKRTFFLNNEGRIH